MGVQRLGLRFQDELFRLCGLGFGFEVLGFRVQ